MQCVISVQVRLSVQSGEMGKCVSDTHDPLKFLTEFRCAWFYAEKVHCDYIYDVLAVLEPAFWILVFWFVISPGQDATLT